MTNPKDRAAQDLAPPIARHEFGHYVTAKVLGFRVGDVTLKVTAPNGHHGTSAIEPATALHSKEQIVAYIENRTIVLYAGALAETLHNGKIDNDKALTLLWFPLASFASTATQDYAKARELVHLLRSISYDLDDDENILQTNLTKLSIGYGAELSN